MKSLLLFIWFCLQFMSLSFCQSKVSKEGDDGLLGKHPSWIMQGNIYEVNLRQYTPEGTIKAFAKSLDRLKAMGVQTLWFMPLSPISQVARKGSLGSYYAVANYTTVNPEFGTMNVWMNLVQSIHTRGMKVLIDWVPNHTGADNRWLKDHPDFFVKDSTGKAAMAKDWDDTRQLDYTNPIMQDSMIEAMKFWLLKTGIDGFRCDVAWNIPGEFWVKCIGELKKIKHVFMLAEGDNGYLARSGIDAVYPWHMFNMMKKVASGARPAFALDSALEEIDTIYPHSTIQLYFTSNHDENSWNQADFGVFPGPVHAPFAVFSQTMKHAVPLIYSGQEEPFLKAVKFFDKDTIAFKTYKREGFYKILLALRKRNEALAADAIFTKLEVGNSESVYAFSRSKGIHKLLIILNFSSETHPIQIKNSMLFGATINVFTGKPEMISSKPISIPPWGYAIYEYSAH